MTDRRAGKTRIGTSWWTREEHARLYPELDIPTYRGSAKKTELFQRYPMPNPYPRWGESPFDLKHCRLLYMKSDGTPVAFWVP